CALLPRASRTRTSWASSGTWAAIAADNAKKSADEAADAALHALKMAQEAQAAYEKAEARDREAERKAREQAVGQTGQGDSSMDPAMVEILCGSGTDAETQECIRKYEEDLKSAAEGVWDFLKENGVEFLKDLLLGDIEACFKEGDVEACLWTVIGLIPWTKVGPVIKAFGKIAPKVAKWLDKINDARKRLDEAAELISSCYDDLAGVVGVAGASRAAKPSFAAAAAKPKPKQCPVMGKGFLDNINKIKQGQGSPRRDPDTGQIQIWTGDKGVTNPANNVWQKVPDAVKRKWGGSLEYDVPGSKDPGTARILVKFKGDGTIERIGWSMNHYWTIYEFPLS
ncbi:hypothetical protein AB0J83_49945, partial [Actinoplanes sp. NPDC049596]|uniref:hypothetical protein n=1 Tax=Actinoplanes sp. NPDC049596 TaxID=3154625 RepID=UPI0034455BF4